MYADDDDDMAYDQVDEEISSDQWQAGFISLVYIRRHFRKRAG